MTTKRDPAELTGDFDNPDPEAPRLGEADGNLKRLLEQSAHKSAGWMPKAGDQVYGTVLDVDVAESEFGEYPLITIETPAGDCIDVHCFHTVLKHSVERKVASGLIRVGGQVAITYFGQEVGRNGRDGAHMYRVAADPGDQ